MTGKIGKFRMVTIEIYPNKKIAKNKLSLLIKSIPSHRINYYNENMITYETCENIVKTIYFIPSNHIDRFIGMFNFIDLVYLDTGLDKRTRLSVLKKIELFEYKMLYRITN